MSDYYTLTKNDVGRSTIRAFGRTWPTSSFIGTVQARDVGKRVYLHKGVLKVENDEQLATRAQDIAAGPVTFVAVAMALANILVWAMIMTEK